MGGGNSPPKPDHQPAHGRNQGRNQPRGGNHGIMHIGLFDRPERDRPAMAIVLLLVGVTALGLQDNLVKFFSDQTSFWQFQTVRSFFNALIIVLLAMASNGVAILKPIRPWYVFLRAFLLGICMLFFFGAVTEVSIAQMAAGLYTYPIFVSLLAGPLLGERVGPWRISAVVVGAIGSFLVLDPLGGDFRLVQTMPVLAGFFYACNILVLRRHCRNESPLTLALGVALVFLASGAVGAVATALLPLSGDARAAIPFLLVGWPELTLLVLGFCVFASLLNLTGNILMARAYQTADSSLLSPLDFSYLIFSTLWAKFLFDAWPEANAALGMALIAAAGVVTAVRESRDRWKPARPAR